MSFDACASLIEQARQHATLMGLKRCSRCLKHKPLSGFHALRTASCGYHSHCKTCHAEVAKASRTAATRFRKDP